MTQPGIVLTQIELKGFKRVHLHPSEQQTIYFDLEAQALRYIDAKGERRPYNGDLQVSIGSGQPDYLAPHQFVITTVNIE